MVEMKIMCGIRDGRLLELRRRPKKWNLVELIISVGTVSPWSTGLIKDHFDGETIGHQVSPGIGNVVLLSPSMPLENVDGGVGGRKEEEQ